MRSHRMSSIFLVSLVHFNCVLFAFSKYQQRSAECTSDIFARLFLWRLSTFPYFHLMHIDSMRIMLRVECNMHANGMQWKKKCELFNFIHHAVQFISSCAKGSSKIRHFLLVALSVVWIEIEIKKKSEKSQQIKMRWWWWWWWALEMHFIALFIIAFVHPTMMAVRIASVREFQVSKIYLFKNWKVLSKFSRILACFISCSTDAGY